MVLHACLQHAYDDVVAVAATEAVSPTCHTTCSSTVYAQPSTMMYCMHLVL